MSDIIEEFLKDFLNAGMNQGMASDEDGFVTLTDKEGNTYVAQMNESEKTRYKETGKPLSQVKKDQKEKDIEHGKKLSEEDVNVFYEKQKTLADIRKRFSDDDYWLGDDDGVGIWYKDGSYKHFNGESDVSDFRKALNKSGIKAVTLEAGWGMMYYGKDDDVMMRNAETDEIKSMADLKKEGIYQYDTWFVNDVN